MATETPIPRDDLSFLLTGESEQQEPVIKGYTQIIRMKPDLITGELLNIGVVFRQNRSKIIHPRLIPSAYPFKVLYGTNGMDNFNFLLELLRDSLQKNILPNDLSQHVVWGERVYAQGNTIDEILNYTYETMITLADIKPDKDDNSKVITIDNKEARRKIATQLNRIDSGTYKRIYRNKAIPGKIGNKHISIDIPFYDPHHSMSDNLIRFGNIVSAVYRDDVYRGFNLNAGVNEMHNASYCFGNESKGSLFILRPDKNYYGYDQTNFKKIDNDIDKARFSIEQHGVQVYIDSDLNKITAKIQAAFN